MLYDVSPNNLLVSCSLGKIERNSGVAGRCQCVWDPHFTIMQEWGSLTGALLESFPSVGRTI